MLASSTCNITNKLSNLAPTQELNNLNLSLDSHGIQDAYDKFGGLNFSELAVQRAGDSPSSQKAAVVTSNDSDEDGEDTGNEELLAVSVGSDSSGNTETDAMTSLH